MYRQRELAGRDLSRALSTDDVSHHDGRLQACSGSDLDRAGRLPPDRRGQDVSDRHLQATGQPAEEDGTAPLAAEIRNEPFLGDRGRVVGEGTEAVTNAAPLRMSLHKTRFSSLGRVVVSLDRKCLGAGC